MNQAIGLTAADVVNTCSEADLKMIFRLYGEEPQAGRLAKAVRAKFMC